MNEQSEAGRMNGTCPSGGSLAPCKCGRAVTMRMTCGGSRYESASYGVQCPSCGLVADGLPSSCRGARRAAAAEWNRYAKQANAELSFKKGAKRNEL